MEFETRVSLSDTPDEKAQVKQLVYGEYAKLGVNLSTRGYTFMEAITMQLVLDAENEWEFSETSRFKLKEIVRRIPITSVVKYNTLFHCMQEITDGTFKRPKPDKVALYKGYFGWDFKPVDVLPDTGELIYSIGPKKVINAVAYRCYCKYHNIKVGEYC